MKSGRQWCAGSSGLVLGRAPSPTLLPVPSIEIDQKLQEIMKQTGYLTIGGQVPPCSAPRWRRAGYSWARGGGGRTGPGDPPALVPCPTCQRYQAEINDLENLGEMGSGTCGQVWKMRFRKTGHIIAVKVSAAPALGLGPTLCVPGAEVSCHPSLQQMRRSGNKEENKRILMDLDVVLKSHDCPYIVQCFGTFITNVSSSCWLGPGEPQGALCPHRVLQALSPGPPLSPGIRA